MALNIVKNQIMFFCNVYLQKIQQSKKMKEILFGTYYTKKRTQNDDWGAKLIYKNLQLIHEESNGTPLQYSCLENPMDGGAWQAAVHEAGVHEVAKSQTRLSDFTFTFHFHALEKEMATHSSVLAWRIPGTEELGGRPSMGSHRVRHD